MKRKLLGLLLIPVAIGGVGFAVMGANKAHAEAPSASSAQPVDTPEPGDTADAADKTTANDPADPSEKNVAGQTDTDAETNDN